MSYVCADILSLFQKLTSVIQIPVKETLPVRTLLPISCALANLATLANNVRPILMTARTNLVSTMALAMIW